MDILEPWLAATIDEELSEALRHWEEGTSKDQSAGKSQRLPYDDDSNLRIPSAKKGPVVQLTKFLTFEDPIQVTLSDSVIRVNASISNQASQRYAEKNRRKLTDGTLGGLIQLYDFEVVATHIGPRDKRLTLYVKDFKSLGSDGSGNFGVAPQAIESREGTKDLLKKLADLRLLKKKMADLQKGGFDAPSEQSPSSSLIKSQPSTQNSDVGNGQESQIDFATQAPHFVPRVVSKSKTISPTTNITTSSIAPANSAKSLAHSSKFKTSSPLASTLSALQAQAAPSRPSVNHQKALLGLLQNRKRAALAPELIQVPTLAQPGGKVTVSSDDVIGGRENEASGRINLAPRDANASSPRIGSQKRKRQSVDIKPRKKGSKEHSVQGMFNGHQSLAVTHSLESSVPSGSTTAFISTIIGQPTNSSTSEFTTVPSNGASKPPVDSKSTTTSSASALNTTQSRISSRDVKIHKSQEALLNRKDSWLPAEPGQREPSANIPISLLKSLNQNAVHHASFQEPADLRKQQNDTVTPSAVTDQTAESESDAPISSGQWPPSPEREQLPPDSSSASVDHSDHSLQSGHGRSASPTTPGASTPVDLGLKYWSERSRGLERAVPYVENDNGLDNVEVSASMPLTLDERLQSSKDEDVFGRPSSTEPNLGNRIPPDALPAPIQPTTEDLGRTHFAKGNLSSPVPSSSSMESDLEYTVPLALHEKADPFSSSALCTVSQPQDPFTQVQRTPYVNGRLQNEALPGPKMYLANGNTSDDTECVSASIIPGQGISAADIDRENESSHSMEVQRIGNLAASLTDGVEGQEFADCNAEKSDEQLVAKDRQDRGKEGIAADKSADTSLIIASTQGKSLELNPPTVIEEANPKSPAVPEEFSTPESNHRKRPSLLSTPSHAAEITHELKRKVTDSGFASPSTAKRQKKFRVQSAFTLTERSDGPRDPSEGARQYRQDFLASRRSSECSTSTMSPTMPSTFFLGTTPEHAQDPSEHSRQLHQGFLVSRPSSETSTPTRSPKTNLTTPTGIIQAEWRNTEVSKNGKQMTSQGDLFDIENGLQKTTELNDFSKSSQIQGLEVNAVPLRNGIAHTSSDRDDAKPGAQDNSPPSHEAEVPILATQNANVDDPDAEQSTVIETGFYASNDETQRAQSIELDVSVRSLDHRESKDDLVDAKDDADQKVNLGDSKSHDQLVNINEASQPVEAGSEKARNSLPLRADGFAEQESNEPTPRVMSDHIAEPENAIMETIDEPRAIEENMDIQVPDKILIEPSTEQRSAAMSPSTPLSDKLAMEPTSDQQLIGVDTDTLITDAQDFQDTMTMKPTTRSGESTDQPGSLSRVVSDFIAVSNKEDTPRLSPPLLDLATPLGKPTSNSQDRSVVRNHDKTQISIEITEQDPLSASQTIYDRFKATYPRYLGDIRHFAAICRKISQLVKANRMEHQSLWDDFIVRHKIEYSQYLRQCAEEAEDAIPYEIFYQNKIEGPQCQNLVISRRNLDEVLAQVSQQPGAEQVHAKSIRDKKPCFKPFDHETTIKSSPVIEKMPHGDATANHDDTFELQSSKPTFTHTPVVMNNLDPKPSKSRILIDLTKDDLPDDVPKRVKARKIAPQSNFSHSVNRGSRQPSPLQKRQDSSSSFHQVSSTPPSTRVSHVFLSPLPIGSPHMPATASARNSTKGILRSQPWEGSDHNSLGSSPKAAAGSSSKRLPVPGLQESRPERPNNAGDSHLRISATPSLNVREQSQFLPNNSQQIIQSTWGIKAHELLEPENNPGQVWPESMLELLANIAMKVSIGEARKRIKEAIDIRTRDSARRGVVGVSVDRRILKSDLEVVRGIIETSSMSFTSSFSPSHTNAAVDKQNDGAPSQWWDDDHSPFRKFARAYASIRHGNGNSFAKAGTAEQGDVQERQEGTRGGVELKRINIMRWKL